MKIHELIDSLPPVQRGPSLTESKARPAGGAGQAILAEALSMTNQQTLGKDVTQLRFKDFLLRIAATKRHNGVDT
jgi:hypothetical protein